MRLSSTRSNCAAAFVAAVAFSGLFVARPAHAQRASLAERVDRLEQQQAQGQGNIELVNQINALQSQLQSLQGQNEELKHQLDQLKQQSKDQYVDLDSRIGRIEGHAPAAQAAQPAPANNGQLQDVPLASAETARPNQPPESAAPSPTAQADAPPPANSSDEKAAYDQAFGALKDGRYAESARAFQAFIGQYPNSELAANAYYWLGESYYVTQNFPVSLDNFNKLLAKYPNSAKASAALLKIGYCQYELKQWDQADATLNQVVQKYPGTQEANLAQGRLRALKLERH